jgi:hypothetical protein
MKRAKDLEVRDSAELNENDLECMADRLTQFLVTNVAFLGTGPAYPPAYPSPAGSSRSSA